MSIILLILITILIILFGPTISYFVGWALGWFTNLILGDQIINGLNLLHIQITHETIPVIFGMLSVIGLLLFECVNIGNNIKKEK